MISLITCTGDRPEAFALCEKYMQRQTVFDDCQWIVVDDGKCRTVTSCGQQYIRLPPTDNPVESFRRNMLAALGSVRGEKILWIEDDDAYPASQWIEMVSAYLDHFDICGETRTKYWHCGYRQYKIHTNTQHASLCQTGIRTDPLLRVAVSYLHNHPRPQQMDGAIWRRSGIEDARKHLIPCSTNVIAIKGVPGRKGLGIHHTFEELKANGYTHDPEGEMLRKWVGEEFVEPYLGWRIK